MLCEGFRQISSYNCGKFILSAYVFNSCGICGKVLYNIKNDSAFKSDK